MVSFERTARSVSNASAMSVGSAYSVSSGAELSTSGAVVDSTNVVASPPPTPTNEHAAADTLPLSTIIVSVSNANSLGNTPVAPRSPIGGVAADFSLPAVRDRASSTASSSQVSPSPELHQQQLQQQQAMPTMKPTVSHASLAMAEHDCATSINSTSGSESGHGHWGIHLLPVVLVQSNLANELRLVFHSLAGV